MLSFAGRTGLAAVTATGLMAGGTQAATIIENMVVTPVGGTTLSLGQSVTTPSGGPWSQMNTSFRPFVFRQRVPSPPAV